MIASEESDSNARKGPYPAARVSDRSQAGGDLTLLSFKACVPSLHRSSASDCATGILSVAYIGRDYYFSVLGKWQINLVSGLKSFWLAQTPTP